MTGELEEFLLHTLEKSMAEDVSFNRKFDCDYGVMVEVTPMIRRIVANNPGPYTFKGTGTYVIGRGKVAVIDPGPDDAVHVDALLTALDGEEITHQLITHTHIDHSPAAKLVKQRTGAKTFGFGPHGAGKYEQGAVVEAGGDKDFVPDVVIKGGDVIEGEGWTVECVHTPGHTSNHLCFHLVEENALFPGDHVMGWSTTVISPPDGDMADYMTSLRMLSKRRDEIYYPTHGGPIGQPQKYVRGVLVHRKMRETQILDCLDKGITVIPDMVQRMYKGLDERLIGAAARSVFSHIIDMADRGVIETSGEISIEAEYSRP
jgi:glyoxylase-like metal-dependent hydrolase (beta-lactamase superfamily II)